MLFRKVTSTGSVTFPELAHTVVAELAFTTVTEFAEATVVIHKQNRFIGFVYQ